MNTLLIIALFILAIVIIVIIIVYFVVRNSNKTGSITGGKKDPNKPVIILFNGFASSPLFWEYAYEGKSELRELNFLKKLKRVGEIHPVTLPFFNLNYYSLPDDPKEAKIWQSIKEKYKPFSSDIDFTLEDLDYANICSKAYDDAVKKHGEDRKFIVIGHSYGGPLALLFSKLYQKQCKLCVCIDEPPYVLKFYQKYNDRQNKSIVRKYPDNKKLEKSLDIIKNSTDMNVVNEECDKLYKLVGFISCKNRIEYYDPKLYVPTLFYKSIKTNPTDEERIRTRFNRKQKREFAQDSNMKLFKFFKDSEHYIYNNQKYSDTIIRGIKKFYQK